MVIGLDEAKRLAQTFVGSCKSVALEKSLPVNGVFFVSREEQGDYFVFSVHEVAPKRVGHTVYLGVSKTTAQILELGQAGE